LAGGDFGAGLSAALRAVPFPTWHSFEQEMHALPHGQPLLHVGPASAPTPAIEVNDKTAATISPRMPPTLPRSMAKPGSPTSLKVVRGALGPRDATSRVRA